MRKLSVEPILMPPVPRGVYWLVVTRALSTLGANMTAFAINVWVFEETRSYALFACMTLLTSIPSLLLAPVVGVIVDRCNKKYLLAACEVATVLPVLLALVAVLGHSLQKWQAALVVLSLSISTSIRWTLMGATIGTLTPRGALNRVNGVQQSLEAIADIGAPLLGAAALHAFGLGWVFTIDLLTSAIALIGLVILDGRKLGGQTLEKTESSLVHDALYGFRWISRHPSLRRLLLFVTVYNLAGGVFTVSFVPHFLSISDKESLGVALALEGIGAFLGGMMLARIRYSHRSAEDRVYLCACCFGVVMVAWGFARGDASALLVATFAGIFTSSMIASLQSTWQANVPSEVQGRVFAARRMVSYSLIPFATLLSIPFATEVAAPLLSQLPALQQMWGGGESGGLAMLLSFLGLLLVPTSGVAALRARRTQAVCAMEDRKEPSL